MSRFFLLASSGESHEAVTNPHMTEIAGDGIGFEGAIMFGTRFILQRIFAQEVL